MRVSGHYKKHLIYRNVCIGVHTRVTATLAPSTRNAVPRHIFALVCRPYLPPHLYLLHLNISTANEEHFTISRVFLESLYNVLSLSFKQKNSPS